MGYIMVTGTCIACKKIFSFNPHKVPSTRLITGKREPVCLECITLINMKRKARNLPAFYIDPNAYEPMDESEL